MRVTAKLLGIILIITVIGIFAACDDDEPKLENCNCVDKNHECTCGKDNCTCEPIKEDPKCECAPGTKHITGDECNAEKGCECKWADAWVNGIKITKHNDVSANDFTQMTTGFTTAFNNKDITDTQRGYMKDNFTEVMIVPTASKKVSLSDGVLTIENNTGWSQIKDYLEEWFYDNEISMLFNQFDYSKNTVRMA